VGSALGETYSDREEGRRGGQCGSTIFELDKLETALPSVEQLRGETFLGTELRDRQPALRLSADALAPEWMDLGVGCSGHGVGSCEGMVYPLRRLPDAATMVIPYAYLLHGQEQTILREALLAPDHNAYNSGQLTTVQGFLGTWCAA